MIHHHFEVFVLIVSNHVFDTLPILAEFVLQAIKRILFVIETAQYRYLDSYYIQRILI